MAKVDMELVKMVLQRNDLDLRMVAQILEDLQNEVSNAVDEEKPPAVKKQFVIMLSDPKDVLGDAADITGWVLQIPEEDSPFVAEERLCKAAYGFNQSPKGRRMPVRTIAEVCEVVGSKFLKEEKVWVKTKEPVFAVRTNNTIPWEKKDKA